MPGRATHTPVVFPPAAVIEAPPGASLPPPPPPPPPPAASRRSEERQLRKIRHASAKGTSASVNVSGRPKTTAILAPERSRGGPSRGAGSGCLPSLRRLAAGRTRVVLVGEGDAPGLPGDRAGFLRHLVRITDPCLLLRREEEEWRATLRGKAR